MQQSSRISRPQIDFIIRHHFTCILLQLRRNLKVKVNFAVIYQTKKTAFFVLIKIKYPTFLKMFFMKSLVLVVITNILAKQNAVYKLAFRNTLTTSTHSAVAQHLLNCSDAHYLANLNSLFDNLNSSHPSQSYLNNFIFNNFKIIHSCKFNSSNLLLI